MYKYLTISVLGLLFFFCATLKSYAVNSNRQLIHSDIHCKITKSGLWREDTIVYQINNPMGSDLFSISFSKISKIKSLQVLLTTPENRVIRKLKASDFKEVSKTEDEIFFTDERVLQFQAAAPVYPYRVHILIKEFKKQFNSVAYWSPDADYPGENIKQSITIHLNPDYPCRIYTRNISDSVKYLNKRDPFIRYTATPAFKTNPIYGVCTEDREPLVLVYPESFNYIADGEQKSWAGFGRWFYQINRNRDRLPVYEKLKLDALKKNIPDTLQLIREIYHRMQDQNRYINVVLRYGGYQTFPAEYVAKNKYGDCKALSNYMHAQLSYLGIRNQFVLLRSGDTESEVVAEIPGSQFNHVLLMVLLGKDSIWLENTSRYAPFGHLGAGTHNRLALLVDSADSKLVRTPALTTEAVRNSRFLTVDSILSEQACMDVKYRLRDDYSEYARFVSALVDEESKMDFVSGLAPARNRKKLNIRFLPMCRDSVYTDVRLTYSMESQTLTDSEYLYVLQQPYYGCYRFDNFNPGKSAVRIVVPEAWSDTVVYKIPASCILKERLAPLEVNSPLFNFRIQYDLKDNQLWAYSDFKLQTGVLSCEEYAAFYQQICRIKAQYRKPIVLQHIQKL